MDLPINFVAKTKSSRPFPGLLSVKTVQGSTTATDPWSKRLVNFGRRVLKDDEKWSENRYILCYKPLLLELKRI